jgi:hypothetical protein
MMSLMLTCQLHAQVISPFLTEVDYNVNIDYINAESITILHNEVMRDTIGMVNTTASPSAIRAVRGARVDGYHQDSNGSKYFSFDADTIVGGSSVLKSDLIRCNNISCSNLTYFFDSTIEPLREININGFTLDPDNGEIIFSIEAAAIIEGNQYLPGDLVRFNSDGNYSLEYDSLSSIDGVGAFSNIDAVSLLPNGFYLISLTNINNQIVAGNTVLKSDILQYNPTSRSWDVAYTPLSFGNSYHNVNVTSLMGFENDLIFKNGFE